MKNCSLKPGAPFLCLSAFVVILGLGAPAAHAAVGDCNNNGTLDVNEAAWANRDDDGDGVCNGIDTCPREPNPDQSTTACQMQAITVPWVPSAPSQPHSTYSGGTTTLKGIARYGGTQYKWDFGDSTSTAWTAIGNAYNLGVKHVYTGSTGQLVIATLSVGDGPLGTPVNVATATYPLKIKLSSVLTDPNQMDVRIDMAIDEGLWYLHTTQSRSTYADGSPGYQQPYGGWGGGATTCVPVDAFALHGSKPNKSYSTDPYVETVQRGLNAMLVSTVAAGISDQGHGTPDLNGNTIGLYLGANNTYADGICGVSFASSGAPTRIAGVGPAYVYGRSYKDITQDIVEWFAYAQSDGAGWGRGGWHYGANYGSADGSTNQWPIMAMAAAEDNMGITVPAFVRTEMPYFLNYINTTGQDGNNGGYGYSAPGQYTNVAKTAGGILAHYFLGDSIDHPSVQASLGYIYRDWDLPLNSWYAYSLGNSYAMYDIMKAMRKPQPNILRIIEYNYATGTQTANSFDWYYTPADQVPGAANAHQGLATNLVNRQAADGHWDDTSNPGNAQYGPFATGWDVLILMKGVTSIPPQAAICNCAATWDHNQTITLDGSCSSDADLNRHIVSYEWDFAYNGTTFTPASPPITGVQGVLVGGLIWGTHSVALRVTDENPIVFGGPQSSIATCNIEVTPPPHCPHPSAGGPYLGTQHKLLTFDASASWDPDADPMTYEWDFDGDGIFGAADHDVFGVDGDGVGMNPTFTFPVKFTGPIAVQVTDHPDQNAVPYNAPSCTETAYSTVEVGNHAPVAVAGGPYTIFPNKTITLDGTSSYDPDGDAFTYAWDLTGNGLFNDSTSATPQFSVGDVPPNTSYNVCLQVTDALGKKSLIVCPTVTVVVDVGPTCTLSPAIVASCSGGPIDIAVDGSNSKDADGDAITFQWTADCGGVFANATAATTTVTIDTAQAGCRKVCTAHLTVSDGLFSNSCDAAITIDDHTAPTFTTLPQDITIECNDATSANLAAWQTSPVATDGCATFSMANNFESVSGGSGGATGSANVTWSAMDVCENSPSHASATVTVVDTVPPQIQCPDDVTVECNTAAAATDVSAGAASASDACTSGTVTDPVPATYALGSTDATHSAVDLAGNTSSCTNKVVVRDTTPPTVTCPATVFAECNAQRKATGVATGAATASDICTAVTITDPAPATFPLGDSVVTHSAVDAEANAASCTHKVTVVDTTPPNIICPADIVVEANARGAATGVSAGFAWAADVCTTATITDPALRTYPLGSNTATHSAIDEAGNTSTCTNQVIVRDTTPPSVQTMPPQQGAENQWMSFALVASDYESVVCSMTAAPTGAQFDPVSRLFSWKPTYDQSTAQVGPQQADFSCCDQPIPGQNGLCTPLTVVLLVDEVNRPPAFDPLPEQVVHEADTLTFNVTAQDPDVESSLVFSAENLPKGSAFDTETQRFSWTPDYTQAGTYEPQFVVSDGQYRDRLTVRIHVLNTNRPPVIAPMSTLTVVVGSLSGLSVGVSDPDDDWADCTMTGLPAGASFDAQTRWLSWTPQAVGTATATTRCCDRPGFPESESLCASATVDLVAVANDNPPPTVEARGPYSLSEGDTASFRVATSDPDGEKVSCTMSGMPRGAAYDDLSRTFSWPIAYGQAGSYTLHLVCADAHASVSTDIAFTIKPGTYDRVGGGAATGCGSSGAPGFGAFLLVIAALWRRRQLSRRSLC